MAVAALGAIVAAAIAISVTNHDDHAARPEMQAEQLKAITVGSPDGTLKGAPTRFEWQPLAGADAYELKLYADDARVLWTSPRSAATTVERPPAITLPAAQQYHWQVQAFAGNKTIGESRLTTFEIF
jgi:hypothetical protein